MNSFSMEYIIPLIITISLSISLIASAYVMLKKYRISPLVTLPVLLFGVYCLIACLNPFIYNDDTQSLYLLIAINYFPLSLIGISIIVAAIALLRKYKIHLAICLSVFFVGLAVSVFALNALYDMPW